VANNSTITIPSPNVLTLQAGLLTGQGTIAGKVSNAGTIAPGLSAGTLNIANDLSLTPASTLQIEIGGLTQGSQYDLLTEAGGVALNLDGTLNVTLINSFVPTAADTFTVVDSNQTLVGAFDNVANGGRIATTDGFGSFRVNYGSGSAFPSDRVVLSDFALVPEPGSLALLGFSAALFGLRRR
jgi:fibronectin-binding autotransporter adhesin